MTTMQKFKAYFGMVPPGEYEDDYLDEGPARHDRYDERYAHDERPRARGYDVEGARGGYDAAYADELEYEYDRVPDYAYAGPVRGAAPGRASTLDHVAMERSGLERSSMERLGRSGRLEPLGSRGVVRGGAAGGRMTTRGALAIDSMDRVFEEGSPLAKITTLRPRDYSEARTIGERFRDGNPVIMDLVEMSNEDAKRLVDFAAGLAFALRGAFDKVATKVFLLSPADVDVSAEDRRKLVETGFYNQS
ncbi:cell division protein SepF [Williamsia deligens]|uniref:Cell division protein SepF n=1 Tax=Williamsia deligens TaxID=321325 RepID=A0ABW3GAK6_9NOCA|nr:cell division protein SepF [Williamsia deligens]MCP2195876.1 cell division inhibitor SepF [Williamsia deligens]